MPFIGIVSEENVENCIRKQLEKLDFKESNILFLKEKSIENIKNITFETIIITKGFKNEEMLKKLIQKAKYVIINSDIKGNLKLIEGINAEIVTYGFNSKATITASSVEEDEIMLCLQRNLKTKDGKNIEPEEIRVSLYENTNCSMAIGTILLLYGK